MRSLYPNSFFFLLKYMKFWSQVVLELMYGNASFEFSQETQSCVSL